MSPSAAATIFPAAVPFTAQETDSTGPIIRCSVPGCLTRIDSKHQTVCEDHLRIFSQPNQGTEDAQVNHTRILTGGLSGTSSSVSQDLTRSNPRKLLLETGKGQPFVRRKTAVSPTHFMVRQSTSQDNAPSSSHGVSALSPPSSRPLAPRPPVHSPPASPGSVRDGDPARKRQKLSPPSTPFTAVKVNGVVPPWLSTSDPALGKKLSQPKSPQADRRASTSSQFGKSRDGAGRPGPKPNPKPSLRKVAPKWSKLRFIDDPGEPDPVSLGDQPNSTATESRGDSQPQSFRESELSPNGETPNDETEGYVGRKPSSVASSTTLIETVDPLSNSARRLSELSTDQGHNKSGADIQVLQQSCQKDDSTPNPQPRRPSFHLRPSQTKPPSGPEPKVPAIDSSRFDSLIYSQPGAASPPPQLDLDTTVPVNPPDSYSAVNAPLKEDKDEALYLDIDPRIHWPQTHSQEWLTRKQAEIQARGNRKMNFGRAASTLRKRHRQQQQHAAVPFEDSLPEKIAENPAWVRALTRLQGLPVSPSLAEDDNASVHGSIGSGSGAGCENGSSTESTNPDGNGQQPQLQDHQRGRGRKANGRNGSHSGGNGLRGSAGGIASKRIGNSGVVVVTGLNGLMKGFDRDV
ncbi:hypothetical protein B0J18DRAFT_426400 [Chaetomium sp. MPI-SDFR-AT-0129]|nr:hypothetical protein B0J18DRAFT_426400 [Chaetomium sp. MPI-SDFR-AT-0129]